MVAQVVKGAKVFGGGANKYVGGDDMEERAVLFRPLLEQVDIVEDRYGRQRRTFATSREEFRPCRE